MRTPVLASPGSAVISRQRTAARMGKRARKISPAQRDSNSGLVVALAVLLVGSTLVLYSPVRNHPFINFDDDAYVAKNEHVLGGLNWQSVRWSLTSTEQGANWHPVTWLSHALDCQLFGTDAGRHHMTSVLIHAVNVLLLFLLLQRVTGAVWCSFVVAALFACHPLNVESVAWVAERKNVLSTLFLFLTIGGYGWYARKPALKRYVLILGFFVLALASKPMVVTLPFALLLLDYWPLQRINGWIGPSSRFAVPQQSVTRLILEKLPLLALSAIGSAITLWVQKMDGAVRSVQTFPLSQRLGNALFSYFLYIWKTFWPFGLSIFYPHPGPTLSVGAMSLSAAVLGGISFLVWRQRVARPFLAVGWLWFLGTLIPVIGIVQVGYQAMADRYAYLPMLGLFVMLTWGAAELLDRMSIRIGLRWALTFVVLAVMAWLCSRQLGYWQDGVTLWSHAMDVTVTNTLVEKYLAVELQKRGDTDDAVSHLLVAEKLDPEDIETLVNLGALHMRQSQYSDAIQELQSAIKLIDEEVVSDNQRLARTSALLNLGFAYALSKNYSDAIANLAKAQQCDPSVVDQTIKTMRSGLAAVPTEGTYLNLALLLRVKGSDSEALSILQDAITEHPDYNGIRAFLGYLNSRSVKG